MHFRIRKNVVQLVRTTYDSHGKKAKAVIVGRMPLDAPALGSELLKQLSEAEVRETQAWIEGQHRTAMLREELAALTLAETLAQATRWFSRNGEAPSAATALARVLPELQALRRSLKSAGLLGTGSVNPREEEVIR